jgi:hypothetical protein
METTDAHQATLFYQFDLFSGGQKTGRQFSVFLCGAHLCAVGMRNDLQARNAEQPQKQVIQPLPSKKGPLRGPWR